MATLTIKDDAKKTVIVTNVVLWPTDSVTQDLLADVRLMVDAIPGLSLISFLPDEAPNVWKYQIKSGERVWKQTITNTGSLLQFTHTFDVPDPWKLSEFSSARPIRDHLCAAIFSHGLQSFKMTVEDDV